MKVNGLDLNPSSGNHMVYNLWQVTEFQRCHAQNGGNS